MMLAILLPAIIAGGLSERHTLVSAKASSTFKGTTRLSAALAVWQKNTATTEFSSNPTSPDSVRLVLKPVKELHDPDLLLYRTAEAGSSDLSQARLLGTFAGGRVYSLTREEYRGGLVLYSLAHSAIVDRAKIEGLP
jgi:hypothetical protein